MKFNITKLDVYYNDTLVGILKNINDKIYFQYDENWIRNGFSISPLSLPLSNKLYTSNKNCFEGVFGVFYDSLPDGFGRFIINKYLSSLGINYENLSILDKLSLTNNSSKGALRYKPSNNSISKRSQIKLDEAYKIYKDLIEHEYSKDINLVNMLGGSSGGARPKGYFTFENHEWLIKFQSKLDPKDIGIKEYDANLLARKCGINTNEFRLFESNISKGYFGSKRFDRKNEKALHMISISSLLETSFRIPNLDYLHLFKVTKLISKNIEDMYEVYKRMCFNVFYKNKDDHGNNFSFIYDENLKSYVLSPFYDITKTENKFEHEMTILGNGNPTEIDLINMIDEVGLNRNKCLNILNIIKTILLKKK